MGDSDIRLVHGLSNPNRGMRADGSDASVSQVQHELRVQDLRRNTERTADRGLQTRSTDVSTGTGASTNVTGTGTTSGTTQSHAASDNFATVNASAWEKFMSEMMGAMDVALATEEAGKDGKIDSSEWSDIFAKASKDGQVTLLDMSSMYAGLQDMHDKGALTDAEYKDGVASLERELSARYGGGKSNGLDEMARLYIQTLEGGGGIGDNQTAVNNQGADETTRVMNRRNDTNAHLATALTDIGINHRVDDATGTRRGDL